MAAVTFPVHYKLGHTYLETWAPESGMFCPACGTQEVWKCQGAGDYEVGPEHACVACGAFFHLPTGCDVSVVPLDQSRLAVLRGTALEAFEKPLSADPPSVAERAEARSDRYLKPDGSPR